MYLKNGVKNKKAAGYNGARTVFRGKLIMVLLLFPSIDHKFDPWKRQQSQVFN